MVVTGRLNGVRILYRRNEHHVTMMGARELAVLFCKYPVQGMSSRVHDHNLSQTKHYLVYTEKFNHDLLHDLRVY